MVLTAVSRSTSLGIQPGYEMLHIIMPATYMVFRHHLGSSLPQSILLWSLTKMGYHVCFDIFSTNFGFEEILLKNKSARYTLG